MNGEGNSRARSAAWQALERRLQQEGPIWLVLISLAAFALVRGAPVDYTASDPRASLLLSQALLEHGSPRLDRYLGTEILPGTDPKLWLDSPDHAHYYWPPGTSFFALPLVWLANLRGEDMADLEDNRELQRFVAALIVALTVPLGYALARQYLPRVPSLVLAVLFVFGSSVVSTLGLALWGLDLAFLLNLVCLLLLVKDERGTGELPGFLVGLLLGAAYLCRPTAALLAGPVLLYLLLARRRHFLPVLAGAMMAVAGLVAFSLLEYSRLLPAYYRPSRLAPGNFWLGLYGNLLAPSRGLFVFHPYLPLFVLGACASFGRLRRQPLFWVVVTWLGLHLLTVASFPHWWGGHSFGSRLFADAYAGIMLFIVLVWAAGTGTRLDFRRGLPLRLFAVSLVVALFIHSYQGLYNPYTYYWNLRGDRADTQLDWSRPQFLANPKMIGPVLTLRPLAGRRVGLEQAIGPTSEEAVFDGFASPEGDGEWRWTLDSEATLFCLLEEEELARLRTVELDLRGSTFGPQVIGVSLNGLELGDVVSDGQAVQTFTFEVPVSILRREGELMGGLVAALRFSAPDAVSPASLSLDGSGDTRRLGLFFRQLVFRAGRPE